MGKMLLFLMMLLGNAGCLLALVINGVRWGICVVRHQDKVRLVIVMKKNLVVVAAAVAVLLIFAGITHIAASTPAKRDSNGKIIANSIAELQKVTLNGHEEWISIRGANQDNPVLLFLAGGPGGTQMAATRYALEELEKHFVMVSWDQPGSGKSYGCMNRKDITVDTYIEDGTALTKYLQERFGKQQIYLMGESWGSALGIFLIHKNPSAYAGFIGTGQMVDFQQTEILDYQKAMEIAKNRGDEKTIQALQQQGEPPYYEGNIALQSATYLNYLSSYMTSDANISNGGYHTFRDMFASEYGVLDSMNYMLGVMNTFNQVYPQLYETDLRKTYTQLEVPVYFFLGRHDVNAPTILAEEYYQKINAPKKELVWFEHSGHSPWLNETDVFVTETLRVFEK